LAEEDRSFNKCRKPRPKADLAIGQAVRYSPLPGRYILLSVISGGHSGQAEVFVLAIRANPVI
jgi:hypothetical protein